MRRFAFSVVPCLVIALMTGFSCMPAYATDYNFFTLDDGHQSFAYGITDTSTAVIRNEGVCFDDAGQCYTVFENGQQTTSSDTVPDLAYVNGTACAVKGGTGLCNGAFDAYESSDGFDLYAGLAGMEVLLPHSYGASLHDVYLNGLGDVLYSSGSTDESYEAIVATPEPSTLLLMGSGLLGVAGTMRRRLMAS